MESVWQKGIGKPVYDPLEGDITTDVLIIGGGITGILCGYMLKNAGIDCVIAEAKNICGGVTENTTAKITCHHGAIFDKMVNRYGVDKARLYVKANKEAVEKYRLLAERIDCDFEDTVSCVYSRNDRAKIEREAATLEKLGCDVEFTDDTLLPFPVTGAVMMKNQAQFHPLKFAYSIARGLKIFENTEIMEICPDGAVSKNGVIKAEKIIVATHFPFPGNRGLYFLKMYQHRSYVVAFENAPPINGIYVDESDTGLSFRQYGNMLLLGGGGHRTGKIGGAWQELLEFAASNYPNAREICRFATQDCMTLDDIPYIGRYGDKNDNLYTATGFNKWGMTSAMVAADVLTDLICGRENEYSEVFLPSRNIIHKQLFVNVGESFLGLVNPKAPRCSHLGCALKYNKYEHSWDCACHGSRFTEDGRVINNPAVKDISPRQYRR